MKCVECSNINNCINDIEENQIGRCFGKCIHDKRLKTFTKFCRDKLILQCSICKGKGSVYKKHKKVEYSYQRVERCKVCNGIGYSIKTGSE